MAVASSLGADAPLDVGSQVSMREVAQHAAAVQREWTPSAKEVYAKITDKLEYFVTDGETQDILTLLEESTSAGEFMAIMDRLRETPWKDEQPLLAKLMRRGIQDEDRFIQRFARIAAGKLGIAFPPDRRVDPFLVVSAEPSHFAAAALEFFGCSTEGNQLPSAIQVALGVAAAPFVLSALGVWAVAGAVRDATGSLVFGDM